MNGIALSPKGNIPWASETSQNALHQLRLLEDGVTIVPVASSAIPYRFLGGPGGCDFMAANKQRFHLLPVIQGQIIPTN